MTVSANFRGKLASLLDHPDFQRLAREQCSAAEISRQLPGYGSEITYGRALRAFREREPAAVAPAPSLSAAAPAVLREREERDGGEWTIHLPRTRIRTLEELLRDRNVDPEVWEVKSFVVNQWEMGAKQADGTVLVEPLFQVKATLRQKPDVARAKGVLEAMLQRAAEYAPLYPDLAREPVTEPHLALLSLPDAHFGKLCWAAETGTDYDLKLATEIYEEAIDALLRRAQGYPLGQILYVVGNDLLNADNSQNTTAGGTPQDCDGRYAKVFETVERVLIRSIERMLPLAPVKVMMVAGNHDTQSVFTLGRVLGAWFRNAPEVEIDNSPRLMKYHLHGRTLLGFFHGHKKKMADLPLEMATDAPAWWAASRHREIHLGHYHTTRLQEWKGVKVRILPSLCGTDAWHDANGFKRNSRAAEAYFYSAQDGLAGTAVWTLPGEEEHDEQ